MGESHHTSSSSSSNSRSSTKKKKKTSSKKSTPNNKQGSSPASTTTTTSSSSSSTRKSFEPSPPRSPKQDKSAKLPKKEPSRRQRAVVTGPMRPEDRPCYPKEKSLSKRSLIKNNNNHGGPPSICTEEAAAIPPSLRAETSPGVVRVVGSSTTRTPSNAGDDDEIDNLQEPSCHLRDDHNNNNNNSSSMSRIEDVLSTAEPIDAELAVDNTTHLALQQEVQRLSILTHQLQRESSSLAAATTVVAVATPTQEIEEEEGVVGNKEERDEKKKRLRRLYSFLACGLLILFIFVIGLGVGLGGGGKSKKAYASSPPPPTPTVSPPPPTTTFSMQQLGLSIPGVKAYDYFGESLALSQDGTRLVVGSIYHSGVNGTESGQVRVFEFDANRDWRPLGNDIDGQGQYAYFGQSVDISEDGNRIIVGSPWPDADEDVVAGSVRVYDYMAQANVWQQRGMTLMGKAAGDLFGHTVAISANGNRIVIGGHYYGDYAGHVQVYDWSNSNNNWIQVGDDIQGAEAFDNFGFAVATNANGTRIVATFGSGDDDPGHARVLEFRQGQWTPLGSDLHGKNDGGYFGGSVAMSADGNRIVVGAEQSDEPYINAGHVQVLEYTQGEWKPVGKNITGQQRGDQFGWSVAMSADGNRIVVGSKFSDANGDKSGQVRVFDYYTESDEWQQVGPVVDGEAPKDEFGNGVALSSDGSCLAASALYHDTTTGSGRKEDSGHVRVFQIIPDNTTTGDDV